MNILFVCTGNTCRSPMAEGILKSLAKKKGLDINVKSAGISVFDTWSAAHNAIRAMAEINIDISNHRSSILDRELVIDSDLILTMSRSHKNIIQGKYPEVKNKVFTLKEYAYKKEEDIIDPFGGNYKIYQSTRDEIAHCIYNIVD